MKISAWTEVTSAVLSKF
uniref:Uncharacterized protein n=1 Tax=Anguilla anguilla TaxID=7936 RepID=A0A0E9QFL6_ANGAN